MPFTSPLYYFFLLLTAVAAFQLPLRWRSTTLLLASYVFYCSFDPRYIAFILTTTVVGYASALFMARSASQKARLNALYVALAVELMLLGFTKYWNPIALATHWLDPLAILIPLGISFYTFQSIGYLVDVYRRSIAVEKNFTRYGLFLSFFPHLLAGPIEPARHFLPQLQTPPPFSRKLASFGTMLILVGLFKKFVIADRLGPAVSLVFDNPGQHAGLRAAFGVVLARYQIYADFSGYTDIALGSAQILGYRLSPNFRRPFFASSISEYWRRWHISLSRWIRDYVFFPLAATPFAHLGFSGLLFATFLVLGLWHGASVNFVLYGIWQAVFVLIDVSSKKIRAQFYSAAGLNRVPRLLNSLCVAGTFFLLVVPPTIFFRASSFAESRALIAAILRPWHVADLGFLLGNGLFPRSLVIAAGGICVLEVFDWAQEKNDLQGYLWDQSPRLFTIALGALAAVILSFGVFAENVPFIYLRF